MSRHGPWRTLGIDPTDDRSAIRKAYAGKLKALDPDQDIAAYTALRNARDHALALARSVHVAAADEASPPPSWVEYDDQPVLDEGDTLVAAPRFAPDEAPAVDEAPASGDPTPPDILVGILFPHGEYSEEPLTRGEREQAGQAIAGIVDEANLSSIDKQQGIEGWLAHHLASAWPRSAFLLEPAAAAFGWLDESGQLSERPAIQFLNQRLKGMRFVHKVEQPSHPLHRAWTELSRPGPRKPLAFLRASRDDVTHLLIGIRERYPEVERHLDPQRVASWEGGIVDRPTSPWKAVWPILLVVWFSVQVLSTCARQVTPATAPFEESNAWSAQETDALATELFGEPIDEARLETEAPALWGTVFAQRAAAAEAPLVGRLRLLTLLAARDAPFEQLVAIKQLKLDLLRLARDQGGATDCMAIERQFTLPDKLSVPPEVRADERALALDLLGKGLLRRSESKFPTEAEIPGAVVDRVRAETGFSEAIVADAAQGVGSDSIQCDYRIALLAAVLRRPGDVSANLLRIM